MNRERLPEQMQRKIRPCHPSFPFAETGEDKFTLSQVMEYRVTDECLPIFNINGTMKKVQKSKLIDKLNLQPIANVQEGYIAIVDMGFLWRLATPSVEDREKSDGTTFR